MGVDAAGDEKGRARGFLPTVEFLPLRSGNGSYRGIPKYRSNSNFKPKPLETASSNGMERYTAV
jgi:hypothetical protein